MKKIVFRDDYAVLGEVEFEKVDKLPHYGVKEYFKYEGNYYIRRK